MAEPGSVNSPPPNLPLSASQSKPGKRPFGLNAIMLLLLFRLLGRGFVLGVTSAAYYTASIELTWTEVAILFFDGVQLLLTLLALVGLWQLRRWAWYLLMILFAASMIVDALLYFVGQPNYLSMLLNVIMVFYVNQREVQQIFVTRPPHPKTP